MNGLQDQLLVFVESLSTAKEDEELESPPRVGSEFAPLLQDYKAYGVTSRSWNSEMKAVVVFQTAHAVRAVATKNGQIARKRKLSPLATRLSSFSAPPSTIQRICELILSPYGAYKSVDKFVFALRRATSVSTTSPEVLGDSELKRAFDESFASSSKDGDVHHSKKVKLSVQVVSTDTSRVTRQAQSDVDLNDLE